MKFKLEIDCNNAAFADGNMDVELIRLLRIIQVQIANGDDCKPIFDVNGNTVGEWRLIGSAV